MSERLGVGALTKADKLRWLSSLPSDAFADFDLSGIRTVENLYEPVRLSFPDASSADAASRLFFRAEHLRTTLLATPIAFDVYATLEAMTGGSRVREIAGDEYIEMGKADIWRTGSVPRYYIEIELRQQIFRLQSAARRDSVSKDAFSVLLNTAREGGLIAVVLAHGATSSNPQTRRQELHVVTGGESCDINRLITEIGSRTNSDGTPRYRLLYFNACNPDHIPLSMAETDVPVIVHTGDNVPPYVGFSTAKVYWPHPLQDSPIDMLMTKICRR